MKRILFWLWRYVTRQAVKRPTRVGLLDTGELILVDDADCAQVLSAGTTTVIRHVLQQRQGG